MYGPDAWSDAFLVGQFYIVYWARQMQPVYKKYGGGTGDSSDRDVCTRAVQRLAVPPELYDIQMIAGCLDASKVKG